MITALAPHRHLNPKEFKGVLNLTLKEYNIAQINHIKKHKWYLSEEFGYEISFNEAVKDWVNSGLAIEFRKLHKVK